MYKSGLSRSAAAYVDEVELEDLALLARLPNPWNPEAKTLIVSGIHAFGTLGAAEFVRTRWGELTNETGDQDFACILVVGAWYQVELEAETQLGSSPHEDGNAVELVPSESTPFVVDIRHLDLISDPVLVHRAIAMGGHRAISVGRSRSRLGG